MKSHRLADVVSVKRRFSRSANVERDESRRAVEGYVPTARAMDVLARIADLPTSRLHERLPWEWKLLRQAGNSDD